MDKNIIEWLMAGPAWIRYATEKQLLNGSPATHIVLEDPTIKTIIARLKDPKQGIPGIGRGYMNADQYENPYWDLFFLADLGLTGHDIGIEREVKEFLETQAPDGTFMTEYGMESTYHCKSAIILYSLARMGYRDEPHVQKYVQLMLSGQRLDGGWYCNHNHDIGARLQYEPSCPQENMNILLLLAQYPGNTDKPRFNGAIDLLLEHWGMRNTGARIVYFGVGRRYQSLCYPATRYGILRVLDAISLYPYALTKDNYRSMLSFVHQKAVNGKYTVESPTPYTGLEPSGQPNRWLTFIVNRIDKRSAHL